jgi:hypothetical protein
MKKLFLLIVLVFLVANFGFSQVWTYQEDFVDMGYTPHGVVVTPDGRIWVTFYAQTDTLPDGVTTASGVYVFNPDGSPAPFSPILTVAYNGGASLDTLIYNNRGISLDNDGNVMTCSGYLYRINYLTGEGMDRYAYVDDWWSLTEAAADENGYIYVGRVSGGQPIHILDEDFELYATFANDTTAPTQRSLLVSADGNDVYSGAIYAGPNGVRQWHSDAGPDGAYTLVDTFGTVFDNTGAVVHNMWAQCLDWDNNGLMWVGTYWEVGTQDFTGWYALDPTQDWGIVDTVGHNIYDTATAGQGGFWAPRNAAWTADGLTMYTADFDGKMVKKWTNPSPKGPGSSLIVFDWPSSVEYDTEKGILAVDFNLAQNYPNPFNPSTKIPFDIKKKFHVKLVIFDMLGRQITTLVDDNLSPKHYEFTFDGSNFSSGTYFYQLIVDGAATTKQMMLIK